MFAVLGVRVTLIEKRDRLLEFADREIIEALSYHLRDARVTCAWAKKWKASKSPPPAPSSPTWKARRKSRATRCFTPWAARARWKTSTSQPPASKQTAAAASQSTSTTRPRSRTSLPQATWSAFPALASVSMEQGRIAAARAFNDTAATSNPGFYPYGIYTIPEISFIGKTEEQLTGEDVPYEVGMAYYREVARGQIRGDTTGRLKLIFHRDTRKVLGVHIIGEDATELVHIGQAVMTLGGTVEYFIDTVFNYPTLAECYKVAAFNGLGRLHRYQSD